MIVIPAISLTTAPYTGLLLGVADWTLWYDKVYRLNLCLAQRMRRPNQPRLHGTRHLSCMPISCYKVAYGR